jgi:hypothetical protein
LYEFTRHRQQPGPWPERQTNNAMELAELLAPVMAYLEKSPAKDHH